MGRWLHENIYVTDVLFAAILMDPGIFDGNKRMLV